MCIVIIDLEATCWEDDRRLERMEIIEIGALKLKGKSLKTINEFSSFVRPISEPKLSDFCKELTTIQQCDVDKADDFKTVFERFLDWIGSVSYCIVSWGEYDIKQLASDCKRHNIHFPQKFRTKHINLKKVFASQRKIRTCGMVAALKMLGIPLEGIHHRGIDDARNIARIAQVILQNECLQA